MQYQVPQFIEVEDKIFGPLTLKQFIYVAGSLGTGFVAWNFLPGVLAVPIALAVVALGLALAFIKVNKKPLIVILEAGFMYLIRRKLYLWKAEREKKKAQKSASDLPPAEVTVPALSENKLKDLSWSLDINERLHHERIKEDIELSK